MCLFNEKKKKKSFDKVVLFVVWLASWFAHTLGRANNLAKYQDIESFVRKSTLYGQLT
jgi:hypothetical protein